MVDVKKLMVPWLDGINPFFSEDLENAWRDRRYLRMMSNEGPTLPQRSVFRALKKGSRIANRYPDSLFRLRTKIGEINDGVGAEWVLLGNGSTEILDMLFRAYIRPGEEVIQSIPCYGDYSHRATVSGAAVVSVPCGENWEYDIDEIERRISSQTRVVVLANPNNPTGNLTRDDVYRRLVQHNIIVVCDEAYIEYSGLEHSKLHIMRDHRNLVIVRTLSKAYGLAGMRFGYALGHPETLEIARRTAMCWHINIMSAHGAYAALSDRKGLEKKIRLITNERDYMEREIAAISDLCVYHSHANYVLIDASKTGLDSGRITGDMKAHYGILLRRMKPFKGQTGLFRITVGKPGDNKQCVRALKDYFGKQRAGENPQRV